MSNKYAEKIKQRREKLKNSKAQTISPQPNKHWFWIFFFALVSVIGFLSYQAYSNNLPNELIIPIVIFVVVTLLLIPIIWYLPKFYVKSLPNEAGISFDKEKERLKLEDDTRKTFAQIVGGALLLGSLIFTYNTFRLQQEGQFTDRFTKAVTQIGDEKLEVRLGGLYSLERIAKDSPKDHWTVMEILSAYIRERARKKKESVKNLVSNSNKTVNDKVDETKDDEKIATDIQTALTIIGRRKIEQDSKTDKINLSETNLSGANLSGANLSGANLGGANLGGANLNEADLTGADLGAANLSYIQLKSADLTEAILIAANLSGANLVEANLSQAILNGADLNGAILEKTNLNKTHLGGVNLKGADLSSCKSLTFEYLSAAAIDEYTSLPDYLENRKAELLEAYKKERETIDH